MTATPESRSPSLAGMLTVRHAGSLTPMCAETHREFKVRHPQVETIDVGGGGVAMARDLAAGKECDVYASVDYSNIPNLLIPDFADWYVVFAATGFVLRYTEKSKYAPTVSTRRSRAELPASPRVRYLVNISKPSSTSCFMSASRLSKCR